MLHPKDYWKAYQVPDGRRKVISGCTSSLYPTQLSRWVSWIHYSRRGWDLGKDCKAIWRQQCLPTITYLLCRNANTHGRRKYGELDGTSPFNDNRVWMLRKRKTTQNYWKCPKDPALEIIRAVRFSNPEARALQYLEALESTFGSSESGEDLYFKFRLMRQNPGEALSEFLRRIDKALNK